MFVSSLLISICIGINRYIWICPKKTIILFWIVVIEILTFLSEMFILYTEEKVKKTQLEHEEDTIWKWRKHNWIMKKTQLENYQNLIKAKFKAELVGGVN